jgi:hypothetical protein
MNDIISVVNIDVNIHLLKILINKNLRWQFISLIICYLSQFLVFICTNNLLGWWYKGTKKIYINFLKNKHLEAD